MPRRRTPDLPATPDPSAPSHRLCAGCRVRPRLVRTYKGGNRYFSSTCGDSNCAMRVRARKQLLLAIRREADRQAREKAAAAAAVPLDAPPTPAASPAQPGG